MISREDVLNRLPNYRNKYKQLENTLDKIDPRLKLFCYNNLYEENNHGNYEILAVCRFLDYFDKYNFNVSCVKKYIKFVEILKIKSKDGMQAFPLVPFQVFFIANIYGWENDDKSKVIKDALLYVPRKASKTSLIAQLAIYTLLFGPPDSQIYCASNSFAQSKVAFDIISASIKTLDLKMKYFHRTREKIYSVIPGRDGFIECLSGNPDRLDGRGPQLIIMDEYSQAKSAELKNVLISGQGNRDNPLIVTITTASTNLDGPFINQLSNNKAILEGSIQDDSCFSMLYEADSDYDDISSKETWYRVQPMLGISVNPDYYQTMYTKALIDPDTFIEFRTKMLNIFTQSNSSGWIKRDRVEKHCIDFKINKLTTRPYCMVGVDLSVSDDMSVVTYCCYDTVNKKFYFYNDFYLPKNTLENHPNKELYLDWLSKGYIKTCGINTIDYEQIGKDIINNSQYVNILQINYDSYRNKDLTNYLRAKGVKNLKAFNQTIANFTGPCESFEMALDHGSIKIDDNPISLWHFGNCTMMEDDKKNRKPIKSSANKKIDSVITSLMCLGGYMNFKRI